MSSCFLGSQQAVTCTWQLPWAPKTSSMRATGLSGCLGKAARRWSSDCCNFHSAWQAEEAAEYLNFLSSLPHRSKVVRRSRRPLLPPPRAYPGGGFRKTLVLDLDHTLVRSTLFNPHKPGMVRSSCCAVALFLLLLSCSDAALMSCCKMSDEPDLSWAAGKYQRAWHSTERHVPEPIQCCMHARSHHMW